MECNVIVSIEDYTVIICFDRDVIDTALGRLAIAAIEQKEEDSRSRLRESWVMKVLGSRPIFEAVMVPKVVELLGTVKFYRDDVATILIQPRASL